jgi:hypothetical protein
MWKTKARWYVARLYGAKSKSNISSLLHVLHVLVMHYCWRTKSTHPFLVVHYCKGGKKSPHPPPLPPRKKDEPCGVHVQPFHWLHANFIPKTICHHFWLKLLTFAKNLGTYYLWTLGKILIYWQTFKHWKFQHIIKKCNLRMNFYIMMIKYVHDDLLWTLCFKLGMTHAQGIILNLIRPWYFKIIVWKYNKVLVWSRDIFAW